MNVKPFLLSRASSRSDIMTPQLRYMHANDRPTLTASNLFQDSKSLALVHASPGSPLELLRILPELDGGLDVGRALVVRAAEHANYGE